MFFFTSIIQLNINLAHGDKFLHLDVVRSCSHGFLAKLFPARNSVEISATNHSVTVTQHLGCKSQSDSTV